MSSHGERDDKNLWGLFYEGTNPLYEGSTFMTLSIPKASIFKYHHNADYVVILEDMPFGEKWIVSA